MADRDEATNMYMETPCGHKFHKVCLEQWVVHRRKCPVCRTDIPPLTIDD